MGNTRRAVAVAAIGGLLALAAGAGAPATAATRPVPGGRILYLEPDGALKSVRADGRGGRDLGMRLPWSSAPDYSPDGRRIAYLVDGLTVHHMAADGTDDRDLGAPNLGIAFPRWSPDGRWITVESWGDIVAVPAGGPPGTSVNLTGAHDSNDLVAAWAPAGHRFATANYSHVRVYTADGGRGRDLVELPSAYRLDWSPDGRRLAVEAAGDLWLVTASSGAVRRLTDTPDIQEISPVWSADGRWLAYGRGSGVHDPDFPGQTADPVIWLMRGDGDQPRSTGLPGTPTSWRAAA